MKYHQIAEAWKDNRERLTIHLEIETQDGEIDEIPAEIIYTHVPNRAATRIQPAEGGIEDVGIIINGTEYDNTDSLRSVGVVSYKGDFNKIIDAHIDDLTGPERDPDYGREY